MIEKPQTAENTSMTVLLAAAIILATIPTFFNYNTSALAQTTANGVHVENKGSGSTSFICQTIPLGPHRASLQFSADIESAHQANKDPVGPANGEFTLTIRPSSGSVEIYQGTFKEGSWSGGDPNSLRNTAKYFISGSVPDTDICGSPFIEIEGTCGQPLPNVNLADGQGGSFMGTVLCNFIVNDNDGDEIPNESDNCPDHANADQKDSDLDGKGDVCDTTPFPDPDGDSIGDQQGEVDNCPTVANTDQADRDGDGIGDACEPDTDRDGVIDDIDNCRDVPNADQRDTDGDGIGDTCDPLTDSDGDNVADANDNCPSTPNPDQRDTDRDGIGDTCDPLTDSDGDNVADANDNCLNHPNADQRDTDGDGIGDTCDPTPLGDTKQECKNLVTTKDGKKECKDLQPGGQ